MKKLNFTLSLKNQIFLALVLVAVIPSIAITQTLVSLSRQFIKEQMQQVDRKCLLVLGQLQQEVDRKQDQMEVAAAHVSTLVETLDINTNQGLAEGLLSKELVQSGASFVLITDRSGRVLAQQIRIVATDLATYRALPPKDDQKATSVSYLPVDQPGSLDLSDLAIVRDGIVHRRNLSGVELVSSKILAPLGLAAQARVGIRPQKIGGLAESKRPVPEGTYDTEQGQIGMVIMAVQPIEQQGRLVGMAIAGYLVNRNPDLVDQVRHKTGMPTVTLFAKDRRVSTNIPYVDPQTQHPDGTRALGTRVSAEVAHTVLDRNQYFLGTTNIIGSNYRTGYRPLYDHTHQLDEHSKPVGIAYVGQSLDEVEAYFRQLLIGGYGIGIVAVILAVLASILIARALTKPVQEIVQFAQAVSMKNLDYQISGSYSAEMGELVKAVERLRTSVQRAINLLARSYYEQSCKLYELGEGDAAREVLQKAITLMPKGEDAQTREIQTLLSKLPATPSPSNTGSVEVNDSNTTSSSLYES